MKFTLTFLSIVAFFLFSNPINAQLNITTGYELNYQLANDFNDIIKEFNTQNDFLDENLDELRIMHGLQLGLQYEIEDFLAFTLGWKYRFKNSESSGIDPNTSEEVRRDLFIRQNVISVGFENKFGLVGYGATFDYNRTRFRQEKNNSNNKEDISSGQNFSSTFFLSFTSSPSNQTKLSVRPYIQVPWSKLNLDQLNMELNESSGTEKIEDGFLSFGLMLIFLNGG